MTVAMQREVEWKRVLVYGLGVSGRAAVRLLRRHGIEVLAIDARPAAELELEGVRAIDGVDCLLGDEPATLPSGVEAVVLSPGVPQVRPLVADARRRGVPVLAEVELAYRFLDAPVVAITGSNGKSTTTALTGALLRACGYTTEVCGNIGEPMSARVEGPPGRLFVVELSSFQLETTDLFRPRAAALLNLSPDHLDRYESGEDYAAAKARIFVRQGAGDTAVLNADDPAVASMEVDTSVHRRTFSRRDVVEDGCFLQGETVVEAVPGEGSRELFATADLPLRGPHNLENAMAACLLARALGADSEPLCDGLRTFRGLPHRLQHVGEVRGVAYYDDSKGTNLAATESSLAGFADHTVHLILGGRNKGGDFATLLPSVARKVRGLYLIGEAAADIGAALGSAAPISRAGTLEAAVRTAAAAAAKGEVVLLSPACASFDQFRSFVERGERFQALVRQLEGTDDG